MSHQQARRGGRSGVTWAGAAWMVGEWRQEARGKNGCAHVLSWFVKNRLRRWWRPCETAGAGGGHGPYCGPGALAGPVLAGVLLPWLALDRLPVPESAGILLFGAAAGGPHAADRRRRRPGTDQPGADIEHGQSLNLAAAVGGSNQNQRAQAFTTGSHGNGYSIASVELYLLIFSSTNYSNLAVSLYTDNSGNPGTKRFDFTNPGSITLGSNTFTAPSSYVLAPSTTYHVVITNGSNDGSLGVTNSDAEG